MKALPKTHHDLIREIRPLMIEAADRLAARIAVERGDDLWALSSTEQVAAGATEDIDAEITRMLEARWTASARMVRRHGLTRDDMLDHMRSTGQLERIVSAVAMDYANALNFALFGKRTFFFSGELTARLAETELNVDAALVQPPFRSCMLVFDDRVARGALHVLRTDSGEIPDDMPDDGPVSVYLSLLPHPEGRHLILFAAHSNDRSVHIVAKRELLLRDGDRVEDALRTKWSGTEDGNSGDDVFFGRGLRFVRIVVNAILYLASSSPDVSGPLRPADRIPGPGPGASSKERKRRAAKIARSSRLEYVEVGGSLPPLEGAPASGAQGRTVTTRFMVRGHWRWQAHGPGYSQRKLVFIEPFWKGPDMADMVSKPYLVT